MAKKVKNNRLVTRVDDNFLAAAEKYIEDADMAMAELIREGMVEYMENHPITKEEK